MPVAYMPLGQAAGANESAQDAKRSRGTTATPWLPASAGHYRSGGAMLRAPSCTGSAHHAAVAGPMHIVQGCTTMHERARHQRPKHTAAAALGLQAWMASKNSLCHVPYAVTAAVPCCAAASDTMAGVTDYLYSIVLHRVCCKAAQLPQLLSRPEALGMSRWA